MTTHLIESSTTPLTSSARHASRTAGASAASLLLPLLVVHFPHKANLRFSRQATMALRATMRTVGGIEKAATRNYRVAVLGAAGGIGQVSEMGWTAPCLGPSLCTPMRAASAPARGKHPRPPPRAPT